MTLNEDYMDESDAERDVPFIDYHLVKKFTAKLPKIGSRYVHVWNTFLLIHKRREPYRVFRGSYY